MGIELSGGGNCAGCADAVDIGEMSYSMVLADDLNHDGKMDLVVSTMNGNVYVFGSPAPYHPLKSWTSQVCSKDPSLRHRAWQLDLKLGYAEVTI